MKNKKILLPRSPKTVQIGTGEFLHFWYSNNKGRGSDNCTIVKSSVGTRAALARLQPAITLTRTSSWSGKVNLSGRVLQDLGIDNE